MSVNIPGLQIHCNQSQQQMKTQITLENRQAHIVFGVVSLFLIGCVFRIILNVEEIHQYLTKDEKCDYVVPYWIRVSYWLVAHIYTLLQLRERKNEVILICYDSFRLLDPYNVFCWQYPILETCLSTACRVTNSEKFCTKKWDSN